MTFQQCISTIDTIITIPTLNNAAAVGQIIIDIIIKFKSNLPNIESALRSINSRVYLIGLPLKFFGPHVIAIMPPENIHCDFGLWIGLNGPDEITNLLATNSIARDDTDMSLTKTGFLFFKKLGE